MGGDASKYPDYDQGRKLSGAQLAMPKKDCRANDDTAFQKLFYFRASARSENSLV